MQFLSLSALVAVATVFEVASAATALERCGDNPKVLNTTTVVYNNTEIIKTTYDCPSLSKRDKTPDPLSKRQTNMCAATCDLECAPLDEPAPVQADCITLGQNLNAADENFVVDPDTATAFEYGTCFSWWFNQGPDAYEYCVSTLGYNTLVLAYDCIPTYVGACAAAEYPWIIEVTGGGYE